MVRKYYIKGVTQDWLLKPGMVVYIEREYDELINRYIETHLKQLQEMCSEQGLVFLYIPKFITSFPYETLKFYTGRRMLPSTKLFTHEFLNAILSNTELSQIQEPSLLFTGTSKFECVTYSIGHDSSLLGKILISRKEKYIENSIYQILAEYRRVYPKHHEQLFSYESEVEEPVTRFRVKNDNKDNDIRNKFSQIFNKILEEDLDDDDNDARKRAQEYVAQLLDKGYTKETIWALLAPMKVLSPIMVTRDFRIKLTSYYLEIDLQPVQKALYLLFLKHPEGIYFKEMPDYKDELFQIYRKIVVRGDLEKHVETITDLVNPLSNSMNEKCSNIKKRVLSILDDSLARHYYISGTKGELKKIDIDPKMIIWE